MDRSPGCADSATGEVAIVDLATGTLSSIVDKATGRELVNPDAALGFNHYVYDRYATVGQSNHNSSKFADIGNLALISSRDVGGPAAVVEARGLAVMGESDELVSAVEAAIEGNPDVADKVRGGKVQAIGALVGAVMKTTRGKADAATVKRMLEERLVS